MEGKAAIGHSPWHRGKWLAFDLETTGVDPFRDVPVSFALVRVHDGTVTEVVSAIVDPGREIPPGATAVHGITTERARVEGMALGEAVELMANELLAASLQGVPIVGMKVDYDLTMLDVQYRACAGRGLEAAGFGGPVLDALVLDRHFDRYRRGRRTLGDLCAHYDVVIDHAHDAAADAAAAAVVVHALFAKYPLLCETDPQSLHRLQQEWHAEWVTSFAEWRQRRGLPLLDDRAAGWPIAGSELPVGRIAAAG